MTALVRSFDASNWNGSLADELAAHPEAEHVVIRIPLTVEPASLADIARQQVGEARAANRSVGGYVWGYRSVEPEKTLFDAVNFCTPLGLILPILWLDCETAGDDPGPDAAWLRRFLKTADDLETPVGLYTGGWWVDDHFPGGFDAFSEFKDRKLWLSDYRPGQTWAALETWWESRGFALWGWQYSGDPLDLDYFRPEATQVPSIPVPDPCEALKAAYARLRASMQAWYDRKPFKVVTKKQLAEVLNAGSG